MGDRYYAALSLLLLSVAMESSIGDWRHPADDTIAQDIQANVFADQETRDAQINVAVKGGKVTLSGTVKSPEAKYMVEQIASHEPGVKSIDNRITTQVDTTNASTVADGAPATSPPPNPSSSLPARFSR